MGFMMKKPYKKMPNLYFDQYMLRTIILSDYKDMFEYGKDIDVTNYLSWGPFILESEAKKSIKQIFFKRLRQGIPIGYSIIDMKLNKMIGTIDFHSKIKGENGAEIGYVLNKNYWNQGIMTKALGLMIEIGFNYLKYDFIKIRHLKENDASKKVIMKNGFKLIKEELYQLEKNKRVKEDMMMTYVITKEDYHGIK
jgi:[ribosomal protein S5]-alanine N-acetyltransferase